jgi:hypothetical protein
MISGNGRSAKMSEKKNLKLNVMSLRGTLKPSVQGVTLRDMEDAVRRGATRCAAAFGERVEKTPG